MPGVLIELRSKTKVALVIGAIEGLLGGLAWSLACHQTRHALPIVAGLAVVLLVVVIASRTHFIGGTARSVLDSLLAMTSLFCWGPSGMIAVMSLYFLLFDFWMNIGELRRYLIFGRDRQQAIVVHLIEPAVSLVVWSAVLAAGFMLLEDHGVLSRGLPLVQGYWLGVGMFVVSCLIHSILALVSSLTLQELLVLRR
jgi:hypothetical protein